MEEKIKRLVSEIQAYTFSDTGSLDAFKRSYTNKKAVINDLVAEFRTLPSEQKRTLGKALNDLKTLANNRLKEGEKAVVAVGRKADQPHDLTLPGDPFTTGARHPLSITMARIIEIFNKIGFSVAEGPEIEDDWHNFTALNFPPNHPARDMQDTFFIQTDPDILLRTHTSSVQVRYMENNKPPIRTISPGRVYRNEAISARSHCFFHQVEGLYIDKNVSFADLKQTLQFFTNELFGKSKLRLRPSYFPFTEPSAEVDVYWGLETETDYRMTKGTGWLEIMGCGMVDPNVLQNCGIDPEVYSGFAFGMGIDRVALLLHKISDIRLLSENDVRFLEQFKSSL